MPTHLIHDEAWYIRTYMIILPRDTYYQAVRGKPAGMNITRRPPQGQNGRAGRGDIHTNALAYKSNSRECLHDHDLGRESRFERDVANRERLYE
eukprot:scaffold38953_cov61-Phaeocystis_antarctica.AAC.2